MDDQTLHHFMEDLLPIVVFTALIIAGAWIISLIIAAFNTRAHLRVQTDFHNRLMEKFSSADEFTAYLQSDAGRSFFENLASEPSPATIPGAKILGSIQKGAILTLLGLGLVLLGNLYTAAEGANVMFVIGVISLTTGVGFLVSSAISYRLAKEWGLFPAKNANVTGERKSAAP